jgi:hypothetical protein
VTSISEILTPGRGLKEALELTGALIEHEYGIRVQFCRIFGKRWAYFSGPDDGEAVIPLHRIELLPEWGIISDGELSGIAEGDKLIKRIALYLQNHSK